MLRIKDNSSNKWLTSCLHFIVLISPGSWWSHLSDFDVLAGSKKAISKGKSLGTKLLAQVAQVTQLA